MPHIKQFTGKDGNISLDKINKAGLEFSGDMSAEAFKDVLEGMKDSDATVADLMTDGCNMGVKSLSKYLNQYAAADETSKDLAKKLIHLEDRLSMDVRPYL